MLRRKRSRKKKKQTGFEHIKYRKPKDPNRKREIANTAEDINTPIGFRLSVTADKGICLFSEHEYREGKIVFSHNPLWLVKKTSASISPQDVLDSFYAMSDERREKALSMYCKPIAQSMFRYTFGSSGERLAASVNIPPGRSVEEAWRVLQIYESNSVEAPGQDCAAVYAYPSRMSHSCRPNVAMHFTDHVDVIAIADIKAGEELTHSYIRRSDLIQPRRARQLILSSNFGFVCRCDRCLSEQMQETTAACATDDGLFQAVLEDDEVTARRLLQQSGFAHADDLRPARDRRGKMQFKEGAQTRPLWMAAKLGHVAVARVLLDAGAGTGSLADRSLHAAASMGHVRMVALLLQHVKDPAMSIVGDTTALQAAESAGHTSVIALLKQSIGRNA